MFNVNDQIIDPAGYRHTIVAITGGLYWLENGLFCYEFEMRKV